MVVAIARSLPASQIVRLSDLPSGLDGFIVIHSTALGPGAGGCRLWDYETVDAALDDAMRLAEGMSYKNAVAGLPLGGAKAVLRRPKGAFDRIALFRAFGRAVAALNGAYITAEDVGTTVTDMGVVAGVTRYVAGLDGAVGRAGGDPSPWTAKGVFEALQAATRFTFGKDIRGLRVAIQGIGNVGGGLCRLLADAGAELFIADIQAERRDRVAKILGGTVVDINEIASSSVDVFAPCALGGVLTAASVSAMTARLVCGGANNQLASPGVAELLLKRDIAYVPDYVANAGGIISASAEYICEDRAAVSARVSQIGPRVSDILQRANDARVSPALIADNIAESIMKNAARVPQ